MEIYQKISNQIIVSYLFSFLSMALGIIFIPILTRSLTIHEFGIYSLLYSLATFLPFFFGFGLPSFVIARFVKWDKDKKISYFITLILFEMIILTIIAIIVFIPQINKSLIFFFKMQSYELEFKLALGVFFLSTIVDLITSYFTAERDLETLSFVSFFRNSLWIVLIGLIFVITKEISLRNVLIIWNIGLIITLIIAIWCLRKEIFIFLSKIRKIDVKAVKISLKYGIIFLPIIILIWIIPTLNRYMINYYLDASSAGFFSLSFSLISITISAPLIIQTVIYPHILQLHHENKDFETLFNALLKYTLVLVIPAIVGIFILRDRIITLVSGVNYLPSSDSTAILALFPLIYLLINIFGIQLILKDRIKQYSFAIILGILLNFILNLILIKRYGINGACISIISSSLLIGSIILYFSKDDIKIDFHFIKIGRILISTIIMAIVIYQIRTENFLTKIILIFAAAAIYFIILLLLKVFDKTEISVFSSFLNIYREEK